MNENAKIRHSCAVALKKGRGNGPIKKKVKDAGKFL